MKSNSYVVIFEYEDDYLGDGMRSDIVSSLAEAEDVIGGWIDEAYERDILHDISDFNGVEEFVLEHDLDFTIKIYMLVSSEPVESILTNEYVLNSLYNKKKKEEEERAINNLKRRNEADLDRYRRLQKELKEKGMI